MKRRVISIENDTCSLFLFHLHLLLSLSLELLPDPTQKNQIALHLQSEPCISSIYAVEYTRLLSEVADTVVLFIPQHNESTLPLSKKYYSEKNELYSSNR